jgi:ankyrin repeat protein
MKIQSSGDQETRMDRTYDRIMTSIRAQNPRSVELGIKILTWLVAARRVLTLRELQTAVAIKLGHNEFDEDRMPPPAIILDICCGLAMIDEMSKEIRLTHFTVHQYLLKVGIVADDMHQIIARACLTSLSFDIPEIELEVIGGKTILILSYFSYLQRIERYPLLEYIAHSLSYHVTFDETKTLSYVREFLSETKRATLYLQMLNVLRTNSRKVMGRSIGWIGLSRIQIAAMVGHRAMVEEILLKDSTSVEFKDHDGHTLLHIAAECGHEAVARFLLEAGANIEAESTNGSRPLDMAVLAGKKSLVRLLCEHNAEIDYWGRDCASLLYGLYFRDKDILRILVEYGANSKDGNDSYVLYNAVVSGDKEIVGYFLDIGVDINSHDREGITSLHFAAKRPGANGKFASYLIEKGANIEALDNNNRTPLHIAASKGNRHVVQVLVDAGANINHRDKGGITPLHEAVVSGAGAESVVEYLLSKGCEIDSQDSDGRTALHRVTPLAQLTSSRTILTLLVERGTNLKLSDNDGDTPLLWAAKASCFPAVEILLLHGADHNAQNNLLHTSLHWAAGHDDEAMIGMLLSHGASHRALDYQQFTPLHWAAFSGSEAAAKVLLEAGADVTSGQIQRQSPLDVVEAVLNELLRCQDPPRGKSKSFLKSENSNIASESISTSLWESRHVPGLQKTHYLRGHSLDRSKLERTRDLLIAAKERQLPTTARSPLPSAVRTITQNVEEAG